MRYLLILLFVLIGCEKTTTPTTPDTPVIAEPMPIVVPAPLPTNPELYEGVPKSLLNKALDYYKNNASKIKNKKYLSVIDMRQKSSVARFYIINMETNKVTALHVAHGSGSDSNHDGIAEKFSNTPGSLATSLGFYLVQETYNGKNGYSVRMDGLSSTNNNARSRAIVIHGAPYVSDSNVKQGRSNGCPAVSHAKRDFVINALKNGSLLLIGLSE